jgi:hypothetical protein
MLSYSVNVRLDAESIGSQNHFTLIPISLESVNAGRPTQRELDLEGTGSGDRQAGENRGKVIAHRDLQPTAVFHDRENRRNLRSRLWAADLQPIL